MINRNINYLIIFFVNFVFVLFGFFWCKAIIKQSSMPYSFIIWFYCFFYFGLCFTWISFNLQKRKSVLILTLVGMIIGSILGLFFWFAAQLLASNNIRAILNEFYEYGLKDFIYSNLLRSGYGTLHFLIAGLSMFTCFLIIEKIQDRQRYSAKPNR